MYVTSHALGRLQSRLGRDVGSELAHRLAQWPGERGAVAYIVADVPFIEAEDGSNGDVIIVVAVDGSVETVFLRRSTQDMSAAFFGAAKVIDMRGEDDDVVRYREPKVPKVMDNRRSVRLMAQLSSGQRARSRMARRKRGAR